MRIVKVFGGVIAVALFVSADVALAPFVSKQVVPKVLSGVESLLCSTAYATGFAYQKIKQGGF
jgi:hypothetical protein